MALLVLIVGACSSPATQARVAPTIPIAPSSSEAWPAHACALVPAGEIAGVLGRSVRAGTESTWAHGSTCAYGTDATFPVKATDTTTVNVPIEGITITFVDQSTFDVRVGNVGPQVPQFRKTAIPNLGIEAWELTGIHFDEVVVLVGRYRVWIDAYAGKGELWTLELQLAPVVVLGIAAAS